MTGAKLTQTLKPAKISWSKQGISSENILSTSEHIRP